METMWQSDKRTIDDPESRLYSAVAVTPPNSTFGSRRLGKNTCPLAYHSNARWVIACVYDTVRVLFGGYHGRGLSFDLVEELRATTSCCMCRASIVLMAFFHRATAVPGL